MERNALTVTHPCFSRFGIFLKSNFLFAAVLLFAYIWGGVTASQAQETQPGDACGTSGLFIRSGGPEEPDGQFMVCDGTAWVDFISWTTSGQVGISTTSVPSTMTFVANGPMGAVQYCDENGGDCFTAASANGLWTDQTTYIERVGNVRVYGNGSEVGFSLIGDGDDTDIGIYSYSALSNGSKGDLDFFRARGTEASPAVLANGDDLGSIRFYGYDGTGFEITAEIRAELDGTPGQDDMPSRLSFLTTPDGSNTRLERMRITDSGDVGIGDLTPDAWLEVSASGNTGGGIFYLSSDDSNNGDILKVQEDGKIGIGITSPNVSLDVSGTIAVSTTSVPATMSFVSGGPAGATQYCDENGGDCFTASSVGGGLWTQSGSDIYYNSGNVGIGTTTPSVVLDIHHVGGTQDTDPARLDIVNRTPNGSSWIGLWEEGDTKDQGFTIRSYSDAGGSVNQLRIFGHTASTVGAEVLNIDRDSGLADFPLGPLHVSNSGDALMAVGSNDGGDKATIYLNESLSNGVAGADGVAIQYDGDNNLLHIKTGNGGVYTERMTFLRDSLGVGIGITSPNVALDVSGTIAVSTTSVPATMSFVSGGPVGATQYCDENGGDCFTAASANGLWTDETTHIQRVGDVKIYGDGSGDGFQVIGDGDDSDVGFIAYDSTGTGYGVDLELSRARGTEASPSNVQTGDKLGGIRFIGYGQGVWQEGAKIYAETEGTPAQTATDMPTVLRFYVSSNGSATPAERMRIEDNEVEMLYNLDVVGDAEFDSNATIAGTLGIGGITSPNVALDVSGSIEFTGTIQDVSDKRLKQNITALPEQLYNVLKLKPVSFEMKDAPGVIEYGLIAQEVEEVYPLLVGTADDEMGTKSMNYMGLISPMLKAMQEQQMLIEKQQGEINTLKSRLEALEDR